MDSWFGHASSIPRNTLTLVFLEKYWSAYLGSQSIWYPKKAPFKRPLSHIWWNLKCASMNGKAHRAPPTPLSPQALGPCRWGGGTWAHLTNGDSYSTGREWLQGTGDHSRKLRGALWLLFIGVYGVAEWRRGWSLLQVSSDTGSCTGPRGPAEWAVVFRAQSFSGAEGKGSWPLNIPAPMESVEIMLPAVFGPPGLLVWAVEQGLHNVLCSAADCEGQHGRSASLPGRGSILWSVSSVTPGREQTLRRRSQRLRFAGHPWALGTRTSPGLGMGKLYLAAVCPLWGEPTAGPARPSGLEVSGEWRAPPCVHLRGGGGQSVRRTAKLRACLLGI